jgi:hypothetical protein
MEEWIERYRYNRRHGGEFWLSVGRRYCCPCCGYPTLLERSKYEICELCYWEDDGQDEEHADEVWGGPNHSYSLRDAQENFHRFWSMYDPESDPRTWCDSPLTVHAKKALAQIFDILCEDVLPLTARHLSAAALEIEDVLRCELAGLTEGKDWLKWSATGLYPKQV